MDQERRHSSRTKIKAPVEIHTEGAATPIRGATSDLSPIGCYIESMFPYPIGTELELKLQAGDSTLLIMAKVVTHDPQVGNGIQFEKMLPEDVEALRTFLESQEKTE